MKATSRRSSPSPSPRVRARSKPARPIPALEKRGAATQMNGDDIVLNYRLAEQADANQSGSGLRFGSDGPTLQRVKLYRYR